MRSERSNIFARRGDQVEMIRAGGIFRYRGPENLVETATVIGVSSDATGIPHVRYNVLIERPFLGRMADGPRILNIHTFMERFRERLTPKAQAAE